MLSKPCHPTNNTWTTRSSSPRPLCSSSTLSTAFRMAITCCPSWWTRCTQKCIFWTAFGSGAGWAVALVYKQCPYCTNDFYLQSSTLIKSDLRIRTATQCQFSPLQGFLAFCLSFRPVELLNGLQFGGVFWFIFIFLTESTWISSVCGALWTEGCLGIGVQITSQHSPL